MPVWLTALISIFLGLIGGAGIFGFVEFLITRKDESKKKEDVTVQAINDLRDEVRTQKEDIDRKFASLEGQMEEDKATNARIRILTFSDEIMHGVLHSEESFNQCLQDITMYERYCAGHPKYKNARAKVAIANIQEVYEKCVREGSFLGMR